MQVHVYSYFSVFAAKELGNGEERTVIVAGRIGVCIVGFFMHSL